MQPASSAAQAAAAAAAAEAHASEPQRHVWGDIKDALHNVAHAVEQPVKDALLHATFSIHGAHGHGEQPGKGAPV